MNNPNPSDPVNTFDLALAVRNWRRVICLCIFTLVACLSIVSVLAVNIEKQNNTDNLNLGTSWVGGTTPGVSDIAVWDSIVTGANATSLGASTTWQGIKITNPGGLVQINADGNTLTNGAVEAVGNVGVDMSAASQDLTLNNNIALNGIQDWNIGSGRTLTLGGNFTRNSGSALRINLADGSANVYLTNGAPNVLLGNSANSTFGNIYFATLNDIDFAGLITGGSSLQIVGGSTIGGLYTQNPANNANPTLNGTYSLVDFVNTTSYGLRNSGSSTYYGWRFNTPQQYTSTNAKWVNGAPAWVDDHTANRNVTVYSILDTTNVGSSSILEYDGGSFIIGNSGTRDLLLFQNNPAAPFIFQNVVTETGTNTPAFLNKYGAGTVELENENTYSGGTRIYEGTLKVDAIGNQSLYTTSAGGAPVAFNHYGSLGVSVRMPVSAFLGWTNSVNVYGGILAQAAPNTNVIPITVYSGATNDILISAANLQLLDGTSGQTETLLNSSTNFALTYNSGSHLRFVYNNGIASSATVAPLLVTNAYSTANLSLVANGTVTVDVLSGNLSVGQFPLIKYSGTIGGSGGGAFVLGTIEPHASGYISNNVANNSIDLVITGITQPLTWAVGDGTWDTTTSNWKDSSGNATTYQEIGALADNVIFDDSASGSSPITVTLNSSVTPNSVTVNNTTKNYIISGSGSISGLSSVTKSGSGMFSLQTANSFTGGLNINGGVLSFNSLTNLGGGEINFNGGTLQYSGNSDDISAYTITFNSGGGTIDDGGNNLNFANPIGNNGAGGFTKTGSGTLTLNGINNYSGNTVVAQGTLALNTSTFIPKSAAIIVNSGATLDTASSGVGLTLSGSANQMLAGEGTVSGEVTSGAGTTISPAGSSVGTLTFGNDLTVGGGTLAMNISSSTSDLISVNGNLTLSSGILQLTVNGTLPDGTYKLIQYDGELASGSGSSGNLTLTGFSSPGQSASLIDSTSGEIDLVIADAASDNLTWGSNGSTWDLNGTIDWLNGGSAWAFTNGDSVTFNDTGTPTVNLETSLRPASVTINNTSETYTFADGTGSGGGKLSGHTGISKSGTGTLIIKTANNNDGATVINAGTVQVGDGGIGDIGLGNITNNGALIFAQGDNAIHTIPGVISGSGSVTVNGSATINLQQNNTYSGPTTISAGTLQVGNGSASGSLGSNLAVTDNGTLVFDRSGSLSLPNNISGSGSLLDLGTAAVTFSGSLTYQGNTTISNGAVKLIAANQIPNGVTVSGSTGFLALAGTLDLNSFNQTVNGLSDLGVTNGIITNSVASGTNILTIGDGTLATSNTLTFSGLITENTSQAGIGLVINNVGTTILTGQGNNFRGGITVESGTLQLGQSGPNLNGGVSSGSGPITMDDGTTLLLGGNDITFLSNPMNIAPHSTVTLSESLSAAYSDTYSGAVSGDVFSTNIIGNQFTAENDKDSPETPQWDGFFGTVLIPSGSGLRLYGPNGGSNTTFELEGTGTMFARNADNIIVGALTGNGAITAPSSPTATFIIGDKDVDSTFSGIISGSNNIVKSGSATLTFSGGFSTNITTPDGFTYVTNVVATNLLSYVGTTTISNGVMKLTVPDSLVTSPAVTLASPTATLDASAMGYASNQYDSDGVTVTNQVLVTNGVFEVVSSQLLNGVGTINGNVQADAGSILNPGNTTAIFTNNILILTNSTDTGILNVTGAASISGTVNMRLNLTNTINADEIAAGSFSIDPNATLVVANIGPENAGTFQLFNHPVNFASVTLPTLTGTNSWQNNLASNGSITLLAPPLVTVNTTPTNIVASVNGSNLTLSWPADHTGWHLQVQTNSLAVGLSNNWVDVPGAELTNQITMPINPTNGAVFFRMTY